MSSMKKLFIFLLMQLMISPAFAETKLDLPDDMGTFRFYGKERFRWNLWDYAQSAPFHNNYDFFSNQLRLGARYENSLLKGHAAWQYTQLWSLPTGASAGAGAGAAYFSNGTLEPESHATYLKYLELSLKDLWHTGIVPTAGRFEYSSGYQYKGPTDTPEAKRLDWIKSKRIGDRLIGGFDWSEYQRSFDGVKVLWDTERVNFSSAAFSPTQGGFEEKAGEEIEDIRLVASEVTFKKNQPFPGAEAQFFHYHYEDMRVLTASAARPDNTGRLALSGLESNVKLDVLGGHMAGAWKWGDGILDAFIWGGWQTGEWFELDHDAYALALEMGYQWTDFAWKPWLRGGYNFASGDKDAADGDHDTFYPMLTTTRQYSPSILYTSMNLEDVFASLAVKPCSVVTIKTEAHLLTLAESADRWYLGSGPMSENKLTDYTARASNGHDDLGVLWDLTMTWDVRPDVTTTAYYGHLFGADVAESFYTDQKDVNFFYWELAISF